MKFDFAKNLMDKTSFPDEAKVYFTELADRVKAGYEEEFDSFIAHYVKHIDTDVIREKLHSFADKTGENYYSCWMLLLLIASEEAKKKYDKRGVTDEVFYDTFSDLRCKVIECKNVKGVWGTFVAGWYGLFFTCRIIKFGRFEYEDGEFEMMNPYELGDIKITNGTPIKGIHIPSSGEPFDMEARLKSYKMAYDFYTKETGLDKLYCDCGSWLLFPDYRNVFPEGGCARDFMEDFDIIRRRPEEDFGDDWRVFGAAADNKIPVEDYPEDTRMRRAFKKYILEGGEFGEGVGIIVFDGEKLLTRDAHTL